MPFAACLGVCVQDMNSLNDPHLRGELSHIYLDIHLGSHGICSSQVGSVLKDVTTPQQQTRSSPAWLRILPAHLWRKDIPRMQ